MKKFIQYLGVGLISLTLASSTAFAGECCKKAKAQVKEGKMCAKCMKEDAHGCCKKAAAAAGKEKDAKACAKCTKKDKEEKKS